MKNQLIREKKENERALKTSGMSYMNMCKVNNSLFDADTIVLDPKGASLSIIEYLQQRVKRDKAENEVQAYL